MCYTDPGVAEVSLGGGGCRCLVREIGRQGDWFGLVDMLVVKRVSTSPTHGRPLVTAAKRVLSPYQTETLDLIFEAPSEWTPQIREGRMLNFVSQASPGATAALIRGISASKAPAHEGRRFAAEECTTTVIATLSDGLFLGARGETAEYILETSPRGAIWLELA